MLEDLARGRVNLNFEVDTVTHRQRSPCGANSQTAPTGRNKRRLDASPMLCNTDKARALEGAIVVSADGRKRLHGQEPSARGPFRPGKAGIDRIEFEYPTPAPSKEQFRLDTVRFEVGHEINSKTPPNDIAADRKGPGTEKRPDINEADTSVGGGTASTGSFCGRQGIDYFVLRLSKENLREIFNF